MFWPSSLLIDEFFRFHLPLRSSATILLDDPERGTHCGHQIMMTRSASLLSGRTI
jgi:hypothetical protein